MKAGYEAEGPGLESYGDNVGERSIRKVGKQTVYLWNRSIAAEDCINRGSRKLLIVVVVS